MSTEAARSLIARSSKTLGIPLPAALTDRLAEADELIGKAQARSREHAHGELVAAFTAELQAGREPLDAKLVQRAALAWTVSQSGAVGAVTNIADRAIVEALVDSADEILSAWSTALEPHSANLIAAAEDLSDDLHHDVASIRRHPVSYSLAVDALGRFDAAQNGAYQFSTLAHIGPTADPTLYYLDASDVSRWTELRQQAALRGQTGPSLWLSVRRGVRPRFVSSLGELMARAGALREHRVPKTSDAASPTVAVG